MIANKLKRKWIADIGNDFNKWIRFAYPKKNIFEYVLKDNENMTEICRLEELRDKKIENFDENNNGSYIVKTYSISWIKGQLNKIENKRFINIDDFILMKYQKIPLICFLVIII